MRFTKILRGVEDPTWQNSENSTFSAKPNFKINVKLSNTHTNYPFLFLKLDILNYSSPEQCTSISWHTAKDQDKQIGVFNDTHAGPAKERPNNKKTL